MAVALEEGTLVDGRYRLERQLGAGGMGVVWSARQVVTRQAVALKFLKDPERNVHTRKRFLREARAACAVRHPNVVQIHDVIVVDEETPVIVMEMLEGESFGAKLKRERKLGVDEFARLMLPVVSAVGTAHAHGIVHRDLKPDNIFLAKDSGGILVKVLDFGVAKLTATEGDAEKTAGLTETGTMVGTPYYMSPEQAFGERDVDHRTDIWALGIIFYQALSGSLPTRAENMGQILKLILSDGIVPLTILVPDLPDDVLKLIGQMLSRQRDRRPADLREVQNVLRRHADIPIASFGSAIAPPRSSGKLPDSSDEYSALAAFAATPPPKVAPATDLSTRAEAPSGRVSSAKKSANEVATLGGSVSVLVESAAGSSTTLPPYPVTTPPRAKGRGPWLAIAVAGLGIALFIGFRATTSNGPMASASSPSPSHVAQGASETTPSEPSVPSSSPLSPASPASASSAVVATAPTPVTTATAKEKRTPRTPSKQAQPAANTGSTTGTASGAESKPAATGIFVDKPPF